MELWSPPHDAPHLFEWWRPLLLASQRVRSRQLPWPIHLDEFRLSGRVIRSGRPDVWLYEHHANGGTLCIDAQGATYKFVATPGGNGVGQFRTCELRTAVYRAGLPEVVEPVWYQQPPGGESGSDSLDLREVSGGAAPVVHRRHLTLINGSG
ncbi:MAG: hypothetical protein ACRDZN_14425 [Acidimicrobiales bacterium]